MNNTTPAKIQTLNGNINITSPSVNITGGKGFNNCQAQLISTNGNINLTNVTNLNLVTQASPANTVDNDAEIFTTGTGNITVNFSNAVNLLSGSNRNSNAAIYTTGSGSIQFNPSPSPVQGTVSLTCNGTTTRIGDTYQSYISAAGSGVVEFNVNRLNLTSSGISSLNPQAYVQCVNGSITGNLQNLAITTNGSQDNFISATGTGSINLNSTAANGSYLLQGRGILATSPPLVTPGSASISTNSGSLELMLTGNSNQVTLINTTSSSEISSTTGAITIDLGTENSSAIMLQGGTSASIDTTAQITTTSDIALTADMILLTGGSGTVTPQALVTTTTGGITLNADIIQLTTGTGSTGTNSNASIFNTGSNNIVINFDGTLTLTSGSIPSAQASIYTTGSGSIQFNPSPSPVQGTVSLTCNGTTTRIGDTYQSYISAAGSGVVEFNVNRLNLTSSGISSLNPQAYVQCVNGSITGNLQNLAITTNGSQDNFISATGTGSINLNSTAANGSYLLQGRGILATSPPLVTPGSASISTNSGSLELMLTGNSNQVTLINTTSSSEISSTTGAITIDLGTENSSAIMLQGGTSASIDTTAQITTTSDIALTADMILLTGGSGTVTPQALVTTTTGGITLNADIIQLTTGTGSTGTNSNASIFNTGSNNIVINFDGTLTLTSGSIPSAQASIYTTGSGSIQFNPSPSPVQGTVSLTCNGTTTRIGDTYQSYISAAGSGVVEFNVNRLNLTSSGISSLNPQAYVQCVNGSITGNLQNLAITTNGSQDNFISATGTGSINLNSTAANGSYLLQGRGILATSPPLVTPGSASISTNSGSLELMLTGNSNQVTLINTTSSSEISSTTGAITIDLGTENSSAIMLQGGTSASIDTTAQITTTSDIALTADMILLTGGSGTVTPQALVTTTTGGITLNADIIQLTTGTGSTGTNSNASIFNTGSNNIVINFDGTLTLTSGSIPSAQASIYTTGSGSIQMNPSPAPVQGTLTIQSNGTTTGSGDTYQSFIAAMGAGSILLNLNQLNITNSGSSTVSTNAFVTTTSGSITGTLQNLSIIPDGLNNATNSLYISTTSGGSIDLTSTISDSLYQIGSSIGTMQAQILTTTGGNITITQAGGNFQLLGGSGASSSAELLTMDTGSISLLKTGTGANILLQGGSGTLSTSTISAATTTGIGSIVIDSKTLTLQGGSSTSDSIANITTELGGSATIMITTSGLLELQGGTSTGTNTASIVNPASGALVPINIQAGEIIINGFSGDSSSAFIQCSTGNPSIVSLGDITLMGGSGNNSTASIFGAGDTSYTIKALGNMLLQGGSGNTSSASIFDNPTVVSNTISVSANNLSLIGGSGGTNSQALIQTDPLAPSSNLIITVNDLLFMKGGTNGPASEAEIYAPGTSSNTMTFSAGRLEMFGGSGGAGSNTSSMIQTDNSNLTLTITGNTVSLMGGSQDGISDAIIRTFDGGNVFLDASTPGANIFMTGGSGEQSRAILVPADNSGTGTLTIEGASLSMVGGSGMGIANDNALLVLGPSVTSSFIQVTTSGNVSLTGGSSPNSINTFNNASIAAGSNNTIGIHANSLILLGTNTPTASGTAASILSTDGDITLTLSGDLSVTGGVADSSSAGISAFAADILVPTVRNVSVMGGTGANSFAQIGSFFGFGFVNDITFDSVTGNVAVGAQSGMNSYGLIGHGNPNASSPGTFMGDITFTHVGGNVAVSGGSNTGAFGQIGIVSSTAADITLAASDITIHADGDVTLTSFASGGSYALIGYGGQMTSYSETYDVGNILLTANNVNLNRNSLTSDTGFSIIGFSSPSQVSHPLSITNTLLSITATQNINAEDVLGLAAPAGIGALALSTDPSATVQITNLDLTTLSGSLNFFGSPVPLTSSINFIGILFGPKTMGTGSSTIKIQIAKDFNFSNLEFLAENQSYLFNANPNNPGPSFPITITAGGNCNIEEFLTDTVVVFSSGNLNITAGENISISGRTFSQTGTLMIAGQNFSLAGIGGINNLISGDIVLVSDFDNPFPGIGIGIGFSLEAPSFVINQGGDGFVRIYSTTQPQTPIGNKSTPSINNTVFIPGIQFADTPQEQWGVYYPGGTVDPNSPFFTIFYKNTGTPVPPVPPVPPIPPEVMKEIEGDIYRANFLISQMLFVNWPILDDYLYWAERFNVRYDYKAYQKLRKQWGLMSSFDLVPTQKFTLQRLRDFYLYEELMNREIRR